MLGVEWTVDGHTVPLEWTDAPMLAPGGYGNLGEVSCHRRDWPEGSGIFSLVVGVRGDGEVLYIGEVAGPPELDNGLVIFNVQGLQERLARKRGRRLYQTQDLTEWALSDADPFSAGNYGMHENYTLQVRDGSIVMMREPATYATNDRASVSLWAQGETITRIAFDVDRTVTEPNHEIRILTTTGPDGAVTIHGTTFNLTGTAQISVDEDLDSPNDMVQIQIRASAASNPIRARNVIRNLRVNGRVTGDTFTLSELGTDLAAEMGWDDLSPTNSMNVLPQDWFGGWPAALTEAALLCDCTWLVLPPEMYSRKPAGLYVGEWGRRTWTVRGADYSDLAQGTIYNGVTVGFESPAGLSREVTATSDPDPYAARGLEVIWPPDGPYPLGDKQIRANTANMAAEMLLEYYSAPRVIGQVPVTRVWSGEGVAHPWDIDAGDLVDIADYESVSGTTELAPQRVVEVSRRADETAIVSLTEATSLPALMGARRHHKRRRRKHRGGHPIRKGARLIETETTPKEAEGWEKAIRAAVKASPGHITEREALLIKRGFKIIKEATSLDEARHWRANMEHRASRRARRRGR